MSMKTKSGLAVLSVLVLGTTLVSGCGTSTTGSSTTTANGNKTATATGKGNKITITMQLPEGAGDVSSPKNTALVSLVKKYESLHPDINIDLMPNTQTSPPAQTSWLTTEAAGGSAPDIVDEFYLLVTAGAVPSGILQNLKPYLEKPDPYLNGKPWLSAWDSRYDADMTSLDGGMYVLVGANSTINLFYNKQQFAHAGITGTPTTFVEWLQDMQKLKKAGYVPLMFGTADGNVEPSWWERNISTQLLQQQIPKFDVNHSQILSGLDFAVGVKKGIISMNNPAYAETWKLLGSLRPYMAKGASSFDSVAQVASSSPPLSVLPGFVKGKYSMVLGGPWDIATLNSLGMKGKFGMFPMPKITQATSSFASDSTGAGAVVGPNGSPEYSVTTHAANKSMTPEKLKACVDFLEFLYSPANEGAVVSDENQEAEVPTIVGAKAKMLPGVKEVMPTHFTPVVEGVLNDTLTAKAEVQGSRLIQEYLGGSMSYQQFAKQWDSLLQSATSDWAQTQNVDLNKYLSN